MRMYQDTRRLDFHALGREIKRKREAKGWTQEYLAQLVDRTPRSIMYFENRGQHPSLNTFYQIVTLLDISVDQFFYPDRQNGESDCRQHIDRLLNTMDEKELTVMEATAEGLQKARETERGPSFFSFLGGFSGVPLNGKQFGCGHTPKFLLAAGPQKCLLGSSPNPLDFGTNCPKVPALCACCLRPVAIAPGPYFPARPSRQADDQYSP